MREGRRPAQPFPSYMHCAAQVYRIAQYELGPRRFWWWWCGGLKVYDALAVALWLTLNVLCVQQRVSLELPRLQGAYVRMPLTELRHMRQLPDDLNVPWNLAHLCVHPVGVCYWQSYGGSMLVRSYNQERGWRICWVDQEDGIPGNVSILILTKMFMH